MNNTKLKDLTQRLTQNINKVIVGKNETIQRLIIALICGGHVLLEDVPGTAKTLLAKTLSKSLDLNFSRVQFTPDLLPSDVTGIHYYDQKQGEFVFREGPVFTNILLADEINRATPRTQSSLLECMEERQVSIDGQTYSLEKPFMVIATQNPVETLGTFPLPEAQLDRFLLKLYMDYPDTDEGIEILKRFQYESPLSGLKTVADRADLEDKLLLKDTLKGITATGGTNVEAGLVAALNLFDSTTINHVNNNSKLIILLCDGDVYYTDATLQRAKGNKIKIYPVLIGSTSGQTALQHIADVTGGKFYYAATAEEIRKAIWGVQEETIGEIDKTDTDGDGLYDIYETAGMMLPNGRVMYTDPFKKDTDGDGLTDAEEMGVLENYNEENQRKHILLKQRGFDSEIYAEYFDYVSNPTKEDTDGDEYSDFVEVKTYASNPRINEVEFHHWNQDFFSVNYTGSETWVNKGNIFYETTLSFGGSQDWFSDADKINMFDARWWSTGYIIKNYGCGLISAADILLYLSLKDSEYSTDMTELVVTDSSNNIYYDTYIYYIYKMDLNHLFAKRWVGLLGPTIAQGIRKYGYSNELWLSTTWCSSKDKMLPRMIKMLDDDIPITLGIYTSKKEGIYFYDLDSQPNDKYNFIVKKYPYKVNSHYVTITGMMIDNVKGQTILEISSWGCKYYINYEEYIEFVDKNSNYTFNNIVYIER